MTAAPRFDMSDPKPKRDADVLLGEDWVSPEEAVDSEMMARRSRSSFISLNHSPLARKIITFNLVGLILLVVGVLYLNPFRDSLVLQHERGLVTQSQLIANVLEARIASDAAAAPGGDLKQALSGALDSIAISPGAEVVIFDPAGQSLARAVGKAAEPLIGPADAERKPILTGILNGIWSGISDVLAPAKGPVSDPSQQSMLTAIYPQALAGKAVAQSSNDAAGRAIFSVAAPVMLDGKVVAVVGLASAAGEIDQLVSNEREQVLQMFVIAILVSIGLSLVLASTIANPLSDLAAAAELGRDKNARKMSPSRVRIPDLAARPDEIGRLSVAMRGMVAALYDRIDANEQFAADVAHEIKNPLASLRSAVASLRLAKRDDQREKLLGVIDHDVRRLDRLVSDISNASRLDSELVKEDEEAFNLTKLLANLAEHLGRDAAEKQVDFITDLPSEPIVIQGLEGRLAQVFVNLITNAISFCEEGDAVRVWARKRENRVLVVVEDTGPGIPEQALTKVFKRFYSERPPGQFGDHSGLGLAISKQIVEAHGGVIWAENIRPTDADITSEPLGARFVVGLPV
ncbi:HAMP domain-containing protein [Thioclava sp. BHET1]|nr:HAMP domain-containing protein [Thioclava sp. BHET1]